MMAEVMLRVFFLMTRVNNLMLKKIVTPLTLLSMDIQAVTKKVMQLEKFLMVKLVVYLQIKMERLLGTLKIELSIWTKKEINT